MAWQIVLLSNLSLSFQQVKRTANIAPDAVSADIIADVVHRLSPEPPFRNLYRGAIPVSMGR